MRRLAPLLLLAGCALSREAPEGPGWRATFEGADSLERAELLEVVRTDLDARAPGPPRRADADDAAFALEEHYRALGWPAVDVGYDVRAAADGLAEVLFRVQEGPPCVIASVQVEGAGVIPAEELAELVAPADVLRLGPPPFVEARLGQAAATVAALYLGRGHLRVQVPPPRVAFSPDGREAHVTLRVIEGRAFRVAEIDVLGETGLPADELVAGLSGFQGQPYFPQVTLAARARLLEILHDAGHADAAVAWREELAEDGAVRLVFEVQAGPVVRVSELRVEGVQRTDPDFVRARVALQPGEPWSAAGDRESQARLWRSGLFRRVRLELQREPAAPADAPRPLRVELEEDLQREVYVEPGWGSWERARVVAGYRDRNVAGQGLQFDAQAALSTRSARGLLGLSDPWFLPQWDTGAAVNVYAGQREEPSFDRKDVGAQASLRRRLDAERSLALLFDLRRTSVSDVKVADDDAQEALETVDISAFTLEAEQDTRDDLFTPRRGGLARAALEWGDSAFGGNLDYLRTRLAAAWFAALDERTVLGLSARLGAIWPVSDTDGIPLQERFFNGGQDTVRSFREDGLGPKDKFGNPLGGEAFSAASVELRRTLRGPLEGALFVDVGNVSEEAQDWLAFDGLSWGLGGGLRWLLPVGPLRLDAAWNPDPRDDEDTYVVHLSVGMAF